MMIGTTVRYVVSSFGLLSIAATFLFAFGGPVFAACSATIQCPNNGPELRCSCPGAGSCVMGINHVACACVGHDPGEPSYCPGGGPGGDN